MDEHVVLVAVLVLLTVLTQVNAGQCPDGAKGIGGKCYEFVKTSMTWDAARQHCKSLHSGGRLATIDSEAENSLIVGMIMKKHTWIGLNDKAKSRKFVWADRSGIPKFFKWAKHQPDHGNERCGMIRGNGNGIVDWKGWNDLTCDVKLPFVCESISECPAGTAAFGSKCYAFVEAEMTWDAAHHHCNILFSGGKLATIDNEAEDTFLLGHIMQMTKKIHAWIGLNDKAAEGKYVWVDTIVQKPKYVKWAKGQPDNHENNEDCGMIRGYGQGESKKWVGWNDYGCGNKLPFVCEA